MTRVAREACEKKRSMRPPTEASASLKGRAASPKSRPPVHKRTSSSVVLMKASWKQELSADRVAMLARPARSLSGGAIDRRRAEAPRTRPRRSLSVGSDAPHRRARILVDALEEPGETREEEVLRVGAEAAGLRDNEMLRQAMRDKQALTEQAMLLKENQGLKAKGGFRYMTVTQLGAAGRLSIPILFPSTGGSQHGRRGAVASPRNGRFSELQPRAGLVRFSEPTLTCTCTRTCMSVGLSQWRRDEGARSPPGGRFSGPVSCMVRSVGEPCMKQQLQRFSSDPGDDPDPPPERPQSGPELQPEPEPERVFPVTDEEWEARLREVELRAARQRPTGEKGQLDRLDSDTHFLRGCVVSNTGCNKAW